jgi:hypothetical protein
MIMELMEKSLVKPRVRLYQWWKNVNNVFSNNKEKIKDPMITPEELNALLNKKRQYR